MKVARTQGAALFVSIHADALPRHEGDAQGATIYTLSDKASDAEAERLAENENKSDAIGGVNLTDEPTEVVGHPDRPGAARDANVFKPVRPPVDGRDEEQRADAQAPAEIGRLPGPEGSDVPSVLVELGYVSNKGDLEHLVSENWRTKTVGSMAQAIDAFFAKRLATAGATK